MTYDAHANYHAWVWLLLSGLLGALVVASVVIDALGKVRLPW